MSIRDLKDAILEIADDMIREADDLKGKPEDAAASYLVSTLRGYARQLRTACRAASDDPPPAPLPASNPFQDPSLLYPPEVFHRMQIEKAKSEFSKGKTKVQMEEQMDGDLVEVIGGPVSPDSTPTFQTIDPQMPIGARTLLAGVVYQLRIIDGHKHLVYDDDQNAKLQKDQHTSKLIVPE